VLITPGSLQINGMYGGCRTSVMGAAINEGESMSQTFRTRLDNQKIPRGLVATLAGCYPAEVSAFLAGRRLSERRKQAIYAALERVERLLAALPFRPDLNDYAEVQLLMTKLENGQLKVSTQA
jgi:hypothetical protein